MNKKNIVERKFIQNQLQYNNTQNRNRKHIQKYKEKQCKDIYQNQQLYIFKNYNRQNEIVY